jgi:hypothetical protein
MARRIHWQLHFRPSWNAGTDEQSWLASGAPALAGTWGRLAPLLELCSSLLSAVRTLAVCACAEATQIWEGIGSALTRAGRGGSAAGTVWEA